MDIVFSTYVEVILNILGIVHAHSSFLHVCGGDPELVAQANRAARVFSTYVEVILPSSVAVLSGIGFLHVCGGDPSSWNNLIASELFSPRMWRWS